MAHSVFVLLPTILLSACTLMAQGGSTSPTLSPTSSPSSSPATGTTRGQDMVDDRSTDGIGGQYDHPKPPGRPLAATGTCDAAHDLCLRPETQFTVPGNSTFLTPIFTLGDHHYRWDGESIHGDVYVTARLNLKTLKRGDVVIYFSGKPPTGEVAAQTELERWTINQIEYVDAEAGTAFGPQNVEIPLALTRIVTNPDSYKLSHNRND